MHNCKRTKEALLDLVFEEISLEQRARLKSDLNQCAACRSEYASLNEVLGTVDNALDAKTPAEDFWSGYEARLAHRLNNAARQHTVAPSTNQSIFGRLKNVFLVPVRIPASVAAVFLMLFAVSALLAVRSRRADPPRSVERVVETRSVEVPVVQERVVTRVVYVEKKTRNRTNNQGSRTPTNIDPSRTPASLAGFRPIDQVKLTVIKGNESNEK